MLCHTANIQHKTLTLPTSTILQSKPLLYFSVIWQLIWFEEVCNWFDLTNSIIAVLSNTALIYSTVFNWKLLFRLRGMVLVMMTIMMMMATNWPNQCQSSKIGKCFVLGYFLFLVWLCAQSNFALKTSDSWSIVVKIHGKLCNRTTETEPESVRQTVE